MRKEIHSGIGFGFAFMLLTMYVIFKVTSKMDFIPYQYREFLILPIILASGLIFVIGVIIYNKILKIITGQLLTDAESDVEKEYITFKVQRYGVKIDMIIFLAAAAVYIYFN